MMMVQRGSFFTSLFFAVLLLLPRPGSAKSPTDGVWSALEGETLQVLKRYSSEPALSPSAPLEQKIGFYLDAGLWSSAEQLLLSASEPGAPRLLMALYARRGRFDLIYNRYQKDPSFFANDPALLVMASQGALQQKAYADVLKLLEPISLSGRHAPYRHYLSALALFALGEKSRFEEVLERWVRWGEEHPKSPWTARAHLLAGYYHLSEKSYDLAFASLGRLFGESAYADLAMLGIGWAYFEMGSPENLISILEGVEAGESQSRHHDRIFGMLSLYQLAQGDLPGAIETGERAKTGLRRRMEQLERTADQIRREEISPPPFPPGSLLKKTLLRLQQEAGEQPEIAQLLSQVNLSLRQTAVFHLLEEERRAEKEQERLTAELARRCVTLRSGAPEGGSQNFNPLYLQARAFTLQGKKEEAENALKQLFASAPNGLIAEETTYRLGEITFERGKYAEAIGYYQPLLDHPESYLYRRALYKTAWSHFRLGHPKEVIPRVLQLWFPAEQEASPESDASCRTAPDAEERREHLRLLALALQSDGEAPRLIDWVREKSPAEGFSLVSEMVKYQTEEGRKKEAAQLSQAWVSAYPLYAETPLLHRTLIDLLSEPSLVSNADAVQARISFIEKYQPDTPWAHENGDRIEAIKPLLKEQLRFLMTHFHVEAKKAQRAALYQKALPWYDLYLQRFPAEKETGEVRFLYGELLGEMKEERRAAENYRASAYLDPPHPLASEAAYREILILERLFRPTDPDLWEGYARFIQGYPSDLRIAQIYLKQAEVAFQEKDYDKSRQFAEAVAAEGGPHGCSKEAQRNCPLWIAAQKLIVQGYLNEKEYPHAIKHIKRLLYRSAEREMPLPEKETTALRNLLILSQYQQGEALKQQGLSLDAAASFSAAYREDNQNELAPLALFESASLWEAGGEKAKAEEAFVAFATRYPQSALRQPALLRLASIYEESDRLGAAAEIYEEAGRQRTDPAFAVQALGQAITLYEKMGAWEKVSLLALQWIERSQGNRERQIEGMVRGAEAKLKLGQEKAAEKILTDAVNLSAPHAVAKKPTKLSESASFYAAKAHLLLADIGIKRYEEIQLVAPLERNLQKKKALFDKLLHDYGRAADYPSPILVVAATHRMGEVFEEFSRALLQSERPGKLSREEREAYDRLLTEQALPYLEKAEEAYKQNIDWAKKAGVESEWVERSRERFQSIHQQIESSRSRDREAVYR